MSTEKREKGFMLVFVVGVIVVVLGIILVAVVINKPKKQNNLLDINASKKQDEGKRLSENVERKNDASRLASAMEEFMNNNSGKRPTGWEDGKLVGANNATPATVGLVIYKTAQSSTGRQSAITKDLLRFITKAKCEADGSTVADNSVTGYAIQYAEIQADGSTKGLCLAR